MATMMRLAEPSDFLGCLFWWRCEGSTLSSSNGDYPDASAITWSTSSLLSASAARVGSYGIRADTYGQYGTFTITDGDLIDSELGTMGFWLRTSAFPPENFSPAIMFGQWGVEGSYIALGAGNLLYFFWKTGGGAPEVALATPTALSLDTWYYVEVSWDVAGDRLSMSIDGVEVASSSSTPMTSLTTNFLLFGYGVTGITLDIDNIIIMDSYGFSLYSYRLSATIPTIGDYLDFNPGEDWEAPHKYEENHLRMLSGALYIYRFYATKRWEIPVDHMLEASADIINLWRTNETDIYFYPDMVNAPGTYYSVRIMNNENPLDEMQGPEFDTYYKGKIILEAIS